MSYKAYFEKKKESEEKAFAPERSLGKVHLNFGKRSKLKKKFAGLYLEIDFKSQFFST